MITIGERIKACRNKLHMTQKVLAGVCSALDYRTPPQQWVQSRIRNYENNTRVPDIDDIRIISKAVGIPPNTLVFGDDDQFPVSAISTRFNQLYQHRRVELLDVNGSCGSGYRNEDFPATITSIYLSDNGILEMLGRRSSQGVSLIKARGDSMSPTINNGDMLFIDTNVKAFTGDGVYLFRLDGDCFIKRLQRLPKGVILAISDNPCYKPFEIKAEDFATAEIIGRFIKVFHLTVDDL